MSGASIRLNNEQRLLRRGILSCTNRKFVATAADMARLSNRCSKVNQLLDRSATKRAYRHSARWPIVASLRVSAYIGCAGPPCAAGSVRKVSAPMLSYAALPFRAHPRLPGAPIPNRMAPCCVTATAGRRSGRTRDRRSPARSGRRPDDSVPRRHRANRPDRPTPPVRAPQRRLRRTAPAVVRTSGARLG
jgi:hypothetical protein